MDPLLSRVFIICIIIPLIALCGCNSRASIDTDPVPEASQTDIETTPITEPDSLNDETNTAKEGLSYSFPTNPEVFDFAELSENEFPHGTWTVNRLINKYGTPELISAHYNLNYLDTEKIVFVNILFEGFGVYFDGEPAERFSFYEESIESGSYDLSESDKDLELLILDLRFVDTNVSLPHGIKIGQTAKSQVLEAYPAGSAYTYQSEGVSDSGEEYFVDELNYFYGFRDEEGNLPEWTPPPWEPRFEIGFIGYFFDKSEILTIVMVRWWHFDI